MRKLCDVIFINGLIYTVNKKQLWAEAIGIKNGKIAFVGDNLVAKAWMGQKTKLIDLKQKLVLPAFIDSHVHPIFAGMSLIKCDLSKNRTQNQILETLQCYAKSKPGYSWVMGTGWNLAVFADGNPHKEILDKIIPDRPVFLLSNDYHSAWVNSKALELAGISERTPDPEHGRIERDGHNRPSGALRESAIDLVYQKIPSLNLEEKLQGFKQALKIMNRFGITGFQDAYVTHAGQNSDAFVYAEAEKRGLLTARARGALISAPESPVSEQLAAFKKAKKISGKYFQLNSVKIFLDGVLETDTAALAAPCHGGELIWNSEKLHKLAQVVDLNQFQLHFHAVGDLAVHEALEILKTLAQKKKRDRRSLIAHLELIQASDMAQFGKLSVLPVFQPLWACGDRDMCRTVPKIGSKRARWLYPIKSVADTGVRLAFGSDWHVSSVNPLVGIEVAVTRKNPGKKSEKALCRQECLSLESAIQAYTLGGAYANFWEKQTGSLQVGKSADLIVLSDNLFKIPACKISKTKVLMTVFEGQVIFES